MESRDSEKIWTITELIGWSSAYLKEKGFEDARLNAELLLCHTLNYKRIDLYTKFDKPLTNTELALYKSYFKRRLDHEPLQYIIGEARFMGLKFKVDKRVLIPRQETEILVEQVINKCRNFEGQINILDIGVGSGNIAVSLAKFIENALVTAIDISTGALEVAKLNIENNNVSDRVELINHDIFDKLNLNKKFDIVVSNPPYISKQEFKEVSADVSRYEPRLATTDGCDGLTYYRRIADVSRSILNNIGNVFVEIAYNQNEDVTRIFSEMGYVNLETVKDYSGNHRVVKAEWNIDACTYSAC
ncbi:MAG: peptide chain release factor N(5)-glutamine methyltransferase [Bacteroidetes bacterium]|nr:peptide chain release factor N(5)-glutamine methyltransferase [Bacteroidota bacterium]MBU1422478.1 peptide chain release factor N(5)-glutamine methyltransferase [Bacteroidota bacterium]MBU2636208.1 peptide chain release factor N(5)-glutamine methyltransferase [Bacteroidota bacterium]